MMLRAFILISALAASIAAAHAFGIGLGNRFGREGAASRPGIVTSPVTGKILLADGVSHLLLADGVSKLCRAGGC